MRDFVYLHEVGLGIYHLDHRLTPEVRAMFASMASRLPAGGIKARYSQIVNEVARAFARETNSSNFLESSDSGWERFTRQAEERLTSYPLHPRVQSFFDKFVGQYGHSSIQEQVGDPALYVEGISWFTAWLLFDSPLVKGQEFSTRAIRHKDWPMARECQGHEALAGLHKDWLEVFESEVDWWKNHLSDPDNRASLGIADKEPFRPALDRARWALPGTISTGACFTSDLRERSRVIRQGKYLGSSEQPVWQEIAEAYKKAQPGIATHALRKLEVHSDTPAHLLSMFALSEPSIADVDLISHPDGSILRVQKTGPSYCWRNAPYLTTPGTYEDPWTNRSRRAILDIDCSVAVARDWHRHRTMYPWSLSVIPDDRGLLQLARDYSPKSSMAIERTPDLWKRSTEAFLGFMREGDIQKAALAGPLGTRVWISGQGGWRDVKYTLELRANTHGANFEYKRQALAALRM